MSQVTWDEEWIWNGRYPVEEKFTLWEGGGERSIDNSSFAYGFTRGIKWNFWHTSYKMIRWKNESTVLEISANFKVGWRRSHKSGDLQIIF